ncbi:MAG: hypothetical protein PHU27_12315 [Salinivirgaceae bacterium]|nr:hypothetical protein [Salinivirgaceae bacterium]
MIKEQKKLEELNLEKFSEQQLETIKGGHPTWRWSHYHEVVMQDGQTQGQQFTWWGLYGTDNLYSDC